MTSLAIVNGVPRALLEHVEILLLEKFGRIQACAQIGAILRESETDDWLSLAHEIEDLGQRYWKSAVRNLHPGAVQWFTNDDSGSMFVFTRGEYSKELKEFIETLDSRQTINQQGEGE